MSNCSAFVKPSPKPFCGLQILSLRSPIDSINKSAFRGFEHVSQHKNGLCKDQMAPHFDDDLGSSISEDPISIDVPVLIVGGGPAGLLQAHLLSQLGGTSPKNEVVGMSNRSLRYSQVPHY